ncbi:MAG: class I SAM-dependent RNA methyltransferase [Proteobacteria bacterium]|nr:class I SAM-dependent RNA methyltransferase [Pseudomonadota bacterium]
MADTQLRVEALGAQGDGVVRTPSGDAHVKGALPGEAVVEDGHGGYALAAPTSPDRRGHLLCPVYPSCGGCSVQHMSDDLYHRWKGGLLAAAFSTRGIDFTTAPMLSAPPASRRKASFAVLWTGPKPALGFHGHRSHDIVPIVDCAVLDPRIVAALPALAHVVAAVLPARTEARVAVLATRTGFDVDVRPSAKCGPPKAIAELGQLCRSARIARLSLAGATLLQLATPVIEIAGVDVTPPPGAFLQASAEAETILAGLVTDAVGKARRVADLFAGAGSFSLALARTARVLAVDSEQPLLHALAKASHGARGLKPIETLRRDLFRDPLSPQELKEFDAVVLDPPRAGAEAQVRTLARSTVKTLAMVSCNPATLARDLRILIDGGYRLLAATPVDQFLYSAHLEAVAVLKRA